MLRAVAEPRVVPWQSLTDLILENHIQQRLVNRDAVFVFDQLESAKAIHKKDNARAGGAGYLRQRLLRNIWNEIP
jgi:hypothetical protein